MKKSYGDFRNAAANNYGNMQDLTGNLFQTYKNGGSIGDDSYFKQAWGQAQGID